MDEADRFLEKQAQSESLSYPQFKKKYGFADPPHNESPVSTFGDSQSPAVPPSERGETTPIDPHKAAFELQILRQTGVSEHLVCSSCKKVLVPGRHLCLKPKKRLGY